ncbi:MULTISPECIES: divalent-cation tolerance protein CutA [Agarivorans]|jgi:periplasmic divalent cation tolerance protein|uniref:Periplasmic divalent cation tolerance protein CutA n=1 Tax=Agarivorans albus MKT 106 TaxID=1331007 RepID=R9PTE3_AGAAL|nr:divalent-cation tolerance protein CutA [Agarivorans albus]GAD02271.1 periplasmic divalent cation tolerance protein CutA [Agarivorans albus MKT 106]
METACYLVLTTFDNVDAAQRFAQQLVEKKLAACVNILPQVRSIYRWQDNIESSSEVQLQIKTNLRCLHSLQCYFKQHHPYDCPEFIALPIEQGASDYLKWLNDSLQ